MDRTKEEKIIMAIRKLQGHVACDVVVIGSDTCARCEHRNFHERGTFFSNCDGCCSVHDKNLDCK
jgi:hypothetical protein